ncbi:MAG: zinc-ribbon domain-containing protein [Promethearchaeota archaeon]
MFCTNCGESISDDTQFCPYCGVDLKEVKEILMETSSISDIPSVEPDIRLSLEGDAKSLYTTATISNEFKITIYNNSANSIPGVEVQLQGSSSVELISGYKYCGVILSGQKITVDFIIFPKYYGTYRLTANLKSSIGHSIAFPIEVKVKAAQHSRIHTTGSIPRSGANQALAAFIIVALVGLILMIGGIVSLFEGNLTPNMGITMIVIGFILLSIGTKGQCCILPFACACDDCDCDC